MKLPVSIPGEAWTHLHYDRPDLVLNLPPWQLIANKQVSRNSGLSNTALRMRYNRGRFGNSAPRSWFRKSFQAKENYYFVHDINDLFRDRITFEEDCRLFLATNQGPPGLFSEEADIITRVRTLESAEWFGPPPAFLTEFGIEMWMRTVAVRLTGVGEDGWFDHWCF